MNASKATVRRLKNIVVTSFTLWYSFAPSVVVLAQEAVDATGSSTGAPTETGAPADNGAPTNTGTPPEENGAPACTGNGCGQGANQGMTQGINQGASNGQNNGTKNGGPSIQDLGGHVDENGQEVLPAGVIDTRQGAGQGANQGASQGGADLSGTNSNTGSGSSNNVDANATGTATNSVNNSATTNTNADATANTGANKNNMNTGSAGTTTGNAGIGVTQLVNDNTTTLNGNVGLNTSGYQGNYQGDLALDFNNAMTLMAGGTPTSIRATNDTTGSDSNNGVLLSTQYQQLNEVQNDGKINNNLDLAAVTGQNQASMNTGNGTITTGNADVAATLVNLLNTTVINGNLTVAVQDIFGDLLGNIIIPDLSQLASVLMGSTTTVNASNNATGSDSKNTIDVALADKEKTNVNNDADINTTVNANAVTGQNDALANTGGGNIDTGNASVSASNISVANTTVEGGNWGLVVVNALNRWLGFLVGDSGQVQQLSQEETLRAIEAQNNATGSGSTNTIGIADTAQRTDTINNKATINNQINADAITGQNNANMNTGGGNITTGNANILASTVNLANTTVKNANLGIAVVNIFGNWFGDLLYSGSSLLASAAAGSANTTVDVAADNSNTGSDSDNSINVNYDRSKETKIKNNADIHTTLNANVDTGNNRANRNTNGGNIETGQGYLGLHSRAVANLTGIGLDTSGLSFTVNGNNDTTGFNSENKIKAKLNDERIIAIDNDANISTILPGSVNTGHNQASQNTVGGNIDSGNIDANIGISNLVNRLVLALGNDIMLPSTIEGTLTNVLTGAQSENGNMIETVRKLLLGVVDNATINNILDLLFTTGSNESNQNTSASLSPALVATVLAPAENSAATTTSNDNQDNKTKEQPAVLASTDENDDGNNDDSSNSGMGGGETEEADTTDGQENAPASAPGNHKIASVLGTSNVHGVVTAVASPEVSTFSNTDAAFNPLTTASSQNSEIQAAASPTKESSLSLNDLVGNVTDHPWSSFSLSSWYSLLGLLALAVTGGLLARRRAFALQ